MLTIKVDPMGGCIVPPGALVKRGEVLGVSPFFDHFVLSPVDGWVEEIRPSSGEPVMLVTITPLPEGDLEGFNRDVTSLS